MDTPVLMFGRLTVLRCYSRLLILGLQIILGSIVTRCPSMSLAPSALVQLDSACDLFSKTAKNFHAEKVLVRVPICRTLVQYPLTGFPGYHA